MLGLQSWVVVMKQMGNFHIYSYLSLMAQADEKPQMVAFNWKPMI